MCEATATNGNFSCHPRLMRMYVVCKLDAHMSPGLLEIGELISTHISLGGRVRDSWRRGEQGWEVVKRRGRVRQRQRVERVNEGRAKERCSPHM